MEISASSINLTPFHALIVAAGSGTRMGGERPKQYQKIGGKTILRHTLDVFLSCPGLREMQVVINPSHRDFYDEATRGLSLPEPVAGGDSRNKSVNNGVKAFSHIKSEDVLLVHDAARPLVTCTEIAAVADTALKFKAATSACVVTDTQKYAAGPYIERNDLWAIHTPQGFHYGLLRQAHEQANDDGEAYTDDTALVAALGGEVRLVAGSRLNFKVTTPDDFTLAQKLLMPAQHETRTGFGYDVHAFEAGDKVRLCGIDIPHSQKLKGHSDADAGLHALTDALLGTIGAGDIGAFFPPSDPQWKNADSAVFLKHAVNMVGDKGGKIVNLDLTLICEAPKIGPYREAMQQRIAALCGLTPDRVGIKATTNEKLGFIGRGEGIAAQAVVSVRFPAEDPDA